MQISKKNNLIAKVLKFSFVLLIGFVLVNGSPVLAAGGPCTGVDTITKKPIPEGCDPSLKPDYITDGNVQGNLNINTGIKNPLNSSLDTIPKFIKAILDIVLMIGVPIVTLAIIYAGFLFVTAAGSSEKLKTAKKTLLYTIIGAALLLGSYIISEAISATVKEISTVNENKINNQ